MTAAVILFGAQRATAQALEDNIKTYGAERVADRPRKSFLPDGLRVGNFYFFPTTGVTAGYDDNIAATARNRTADVVTQLGSGLRIISDLPRHSFDFAFNGRFTKYAQHERFDNADLAAVFDGKIHIDRAHTIDAKLISRYDHLSVIGPEQPLTVREPIPYWRHSAAAGFKRDAGRLWASVGAKAETTSYEDVRSLDGRLIRASDYNQDIYSTTGTLGYRFSPGFDLQSTVRGLRQISPGTGPIDRDAWGYDAAVGLNAEINPLLRWQVFGGVGTREYDSGLAPLTTAVGWVKLTWLPTQLTTVYVTAKREIGETTISANATGRIDNHLSVSIEQELLRNLVFTVQGQYHNLEFIGETRRDQLYVGQAGLKYLHTKHAHFSLSFEHQNRQSNVLDATMSRNRIWLGAQIQF